MLTGQLDCNANLSNRGQRLVVAINLAILSILPMLLDHAEHGILERVECYNFMCHDHFAVDLGPLINFIVGKNGSGKSAVLTAITLCLGGKASATNRGQSLKSFIKEGKEYVRINPAFVPAI